MKNKKLRTTVLALFLTFIFILLTACDPNTVELQGQPRPAVPERVLIECQSSCEQTAATVQQLGGDISMRYENIDALAAIIPANKLTTLAAKLGRNAISKDVTLRLPVPSTVRQFYPNNHQLDATISARSSDALTGTQYNFSKIGAEQLQSQGFAGQDIVVAVIDSGTANNPQLVDSLAGSVIGGESFVPIPDEPSATSTLNEDHGTAVASLIAGHGNFQFDITELFVQSLQLYSPSSVITVDDTTAAVPLVGSAPQAKIYAMKVFPATGEGAARSWVIAAMDRALTLKQNFDAGMPAVPISGDDTEDNPYVYDALDIRVVNMSLGGPTLFAGHDMEDELALKMLDNGIVVVVAAGNEGPAGITVGSPATSLGVLSVGAASDPVNERVLRDLQAEELGFGEIFRPTDHIQTAYFSSRGPNADGSQGVHVMANGIATYTQTSDGNIAFISGTSLSSPTVAGAVATLMSAAPDKTAAEIRQAIIQSADASVIQDQSMTIDQGNGYVSLPAALELLNQGVSAPLPQLPTISQPLSVPSLLTDAGYTILSSLQDIEQTVTLIPGQSHHLFVETEENISELTVDFTEVTPHLPLEQQNLLFTDDLIVSIIDAPTSINMIMAEDFVWEPTSYTFENPQPGVIRIALLGDWTNVGPVTATVRVSAKSGDEGDDILEGKLTDDEIHDALLRVREGTTRVEFTLFWEDGWNSFPAHDLDLYLVDPDGNFYVDGATISMPERVIIDDPLPGTWTVYVDGYEVHGFRDEYELIAVDQDGRSLQVLDSSQR